MRAILNYTVDVDSEEGYTAYFDWSRSGALMLDIDSSFIYTNVDTYGDHTLAVL